MRWPCHRTSDTPFLFKYWLKCSPRQQEEIRRHGRVSLQQPVWGSLNHLTGTGHLHVAAESETLMVAAAAGSETSHFTPPCLLHCCPCCKERGRRRRNFTPLRFIYLTTLFQLVCITTCDTHRVAGPATFAGMYQGTGSTLGQPSKHLQKYIPG